MNRKPTLETVCTCNNTRSVIGEVTGRDIITQEGLPINITSSGIWAGEEHYNDNWPEARCAYIINSATRALEEDTKHVFPGARKHIQAIDDILTSHKIYDIEHQRFTEEPAYRKRIQQVALRLGIEALQPMECTLREAALNALGLHYHGTRRQTVADPGVDLYVGFTQNHVDTTTKIVQELVPAPQVALIGPYVEREVTRLVADDLLSNARLEPYAELARAMHADIMPEVLARFWRERR